MCHAGAKCERNLRIRIPSKIITKNRRTEGRKEKKLEERQVGKCALSSTASATKTPEQQTNERQGYKQYTPRPGAQEPCTSNCVWVRERDVRGGQLDTFILH
jgi:hypothetical protein